MEARRVRALLIGSLILPISLAAFLAVTRPGAWRVPCAVVAYGLTSLLLLRAERHAGLFLTLLALNVCLLTPELLLRAAGFRYESGIQFGYPRPRSFVRLEPHPRLFWTLPPGPGVNTLGFEGPEVASPKPPGVFRIVVLSDSVGFQGYPAVVARRLQGSRGALRFECVSLSLTGYSSHQGLVLAKTLGKGLEADAAVVAYGWNDHWLAWGAPDHVKRIADRDSTVERVAGAGQRLRVVQAARWLARGRREERPLPVPRVPLDRYRENLGRIADVFLEQGAFVLLLTSPSTHERLGVPHYLVADGFAPDEAWVLARHREYNAAVRELALRRGLGLVDLDGELAGALDLPSLFLADGIHLTPAGIDTVASRVAAALADTPASKPASNQNAP